MRLRKLRVTGFKSFVEPAELLIEPGLTGVVSGQRRNRRAIGYGASGRAPSGAWPSLPSSATRSRVTGSAESS